MGASSAANRFASKRHSNEIVVNGLTKKDLNNPIKINEIRLEHFENFKKLRRKMDHAYLKVRDLQGTAGGACQADTSRSVYSAAPAA